MKQRLKLRLEFDGAGYCGWQLQSEGPGYTGLPSLQATLERALATVLRRPGERLPVQGCGRTDSGVHAEEFFCHFDLPAEFSFDGDELEKFRHRVNCVLPESIVLTHAFNAPGFDALRDVTQKTYEYRILLRRAKPVLHRGRCHWIPAESPQCATFDVERLRAALPLLEGEHDFVAFAASNSSAKTTVREILKAEALVEGALLRLRFTGRGFLKQMVRTLSGTLIELAEGRRDLDSIRNLLQLPGRRQEAGFCTPPEGLFLVKVVYPDGAT